MQPQKRYYRTEQARGAIAQLVEQRTENPCVPGSIPGGTTIDSVIKNPLNFKSSRDFFIPRIAICNRLYFGSVVILGGLSLVNSLHAYTFASLKRKKLISTTPLNDALNALILALNASAAAFVLLFTKKFRILS